MNEHGQKEYENRPQKGSRRILKWLAGLFILIMGLILSGAVYESVSETSDARAYPPLGKMVNIGGYRLHIKCRGRGSPTVVIESGWGDSSASWGWVQPESAKKIRVCAYDRAGMGWSEVSPEPRTAREFAKELHNLLAEADESGPYVLVGHSLGGYTLRVYAHDYPAEVAGLIFVDPQNLSVSEISTPVPAPKPGGLSVPALMARIGIARLLAGPLGSIQNLPDADKQAYTATSVTPRSVQTVLDEGRGMSEGAAQARAVTTLGELPLIVLSRAKDMDTDTVASQSRYLQLSTNNQHLIADKSGHSIMIEQPDAVISAIANMVEMVRGNTDEL